MTTEALWMATDQLTKPQRRRVQRDTDGDMTAAAEAQVALYWIKHDVTKTVCHLADYRRHARVLGLAGTSHATIPCLWDQAEAAVVNAGEQAEGGGTSPLRERSPADLELMETLYKIRDAIHAELERHGRVPRTSMPDRIRQVASIVGATADEKLIVWWSTRVARWVRDLTAKLDAADAQPKPIRIRDTPCPECGARQVRVFEQDEWRMVPPIRIDFRDGAVRAAVCTVGDDPKGPSGCGHVWFRGDELNALADTLGRSAVVANAG